MNENNEFTPSEPIGPRPAEQPAQQYYPAAPRPTYFPTGKRERVYALFLLLASLMTADAYLWGGFGIAATVSTVFLASVSACYLLRGGKRWSVYGIFCFAAFLACAVQFTFSDDTEFNLLALADMVLLAAVAMLERADLRQYHDGSFRSIADLCYMIFALTFGKLGQAFYTLFHSEKSGEKRKLGSVLLGILIALPVLAVVIPLLASSDAAFSAMLEHWLSFDYIGEAFIVLIFGLALFLLLFGRLVSLPHVRRSDPPCSSGSGLEPTVVIAFLGAIAAVYVLYLFSQLAYFFNAFSGLLPEKFTVAEYARRGFFEMTLISAFNLGILLLSYLICRKKDGRTPMAVRVLSLFLCLFSLVLSVTVLSKLRLYIGSFGMTRLRIVTSVFTVFLIAVFLSVAVRLFVKKMPYMKVALVVGTALLLVCGFVGTDRTIARYNIDAYLSGELETIDMQALRRLPSDAIVGDVLRLLDVPDAEVVQEAKELLSAHADGLFDYYYERGGKVEIAGRKGDWRSWNTESSEAAQLLQERFDDYYINSSSED